MYKGIGLTLWGVNIDALLELWFKHHFVPLLKNKYGEDCVFYTMILDDAKTHNWRSPGLYIMHDLVLGDLDRVKRPDGLYNNVIHKLARVLRTVERLASGSNVSHRGLVRPGDFVFHGAAFHRGFYGGTSGGTEEADVWVFERTIDALITIRDTVASVLIAAAKLRTDDSLPGTKYIERDVTPEEHLQILANFGVHMRDDGMYYVPDSWIMPTPV